MADVRSRIFDIVEIQVDRAIERSHDLCCIHRLERPNGMHIEIHRACAVHLVERADSVGFRDGRIAASCAFGARTVASTIGVGDE